MNKMLTHEDLFLFLLDSRWLNQDEYARCISVDPGTLSRNKVRIVNGQPFSKGIVDSLSNQSKSLGEAMYKSRSGQALLSLLEFLSGRFAMLKTQDKILGEIKKAVEGNESQEDLLIQWVSTLQSRGAQRSIPKSWDEVTTVFQDHNNSAGNTDLFAIEKEQYIKKTMNLPICNMLVLNDEKEETINLSNNGSNALRDVTHTIFLVKDNEPCTIQIGTGINSDEFDDVKISDLSININGLPMKQYYSTAGMTKCENELIINAKQAEIFIQLPIFQADSSIKIELQYHVVYTHPSERIVLFFQIKAPCKEMEHSYILQGDAQVQCEMEASTFYPLQLYQKKASTSVKFNRTVITTYFCDWEIAGAGYSLIIRKRSV